MHTHIFRFIFLQKKWELFDFYSFSLYSARRLDFKNWDGTALYR